MRAHGASHEEFDEPESPRIYSVTSIASMSEVEHSLQARGLTFIKRGGVVSAVEPPPEPIDMKAEDSACAMLERDMTTHGFRWSVVNPWSVADDVAREKAAAAAAASRGEGEGARVRVADSVSSYSVNAPAASAAPAAGAHHESHVFIYALRSCSKWPGAKIMLVDAAKGEVHYIDDERVIKIKPMPGSKVSADMISRDQMHVWYKGDKAPVEHTLYAEGYRDHAVNMLKIRSKPKFDLYCVHRGVLNKRGKSGLTGKDRYMRLVNGQLVMYRDERSSYPVGVLALGGMEVERRGDKQIRVEGPERGHVFKARSRADRDIWLDAIERATARADHERQLLERHVRICRMRSRLAKRAQRKGKYGRSRSRPSGRGRTGGARQGGGTRVADDFDLRRHSRDDSRAPVGDMRIPDFGPRPMSGRLHGTAPLPELEDLKEEESVSLASETPAPASSSSPAPRQQERPASASSKPKNAVPRVWSQSSMGSRAGGSSSAYFDDDEKAAPPARRRASSGAGIVSGPGGALASGSSRPSKAAVKSSGYGRQTPGPRAGARSRVADGKKRRPKAAAASSRKDVTEGDLRALKAQRRRRGASRGSVDGGDSSDTASVKSAASSASTKVSRRSKASAGGAPARRKTKPRTPRGAAAAAHEGGGGGGGGGRRAVAELVVSLVDEYNDREPLGIIFASPEDSLEAFRKRVQRELDQLPRSWVFLREMVPVGRRQETKKRLSYVVSGGHVLLREAGVV